MDRVNKLKTVLWFLTGIGAAVATARFMFGLGATTNLSDGTPWGLWIGFDVMSGVALAAGGFVITASVYIFKLEKFHVIVRPAVLTAFLGYIAVAVGLLFDLGLPWNIWHMVIFWNPHSPLFEVGWCVMLYLAVLSLEFFPVPAEEFSALAKIRRFLIKLRLPLVIAGIALSTLHQSSLGSLFLIMPYHVHPLWYTPILPIIFFISAIGLGLMMVTFESLFTSHFYRRKPETELLGKLGAAARWIFVLYLIVRFSDLAIRGQLGALGSDEWQVKMFWVELAIMAFIPTILLFIRKARTSTTGQWIIAISGVTGVVLNRIDTGGLTHLNRSESIYLPAWTEVSISVMVVAIAALVFMFMVERFKVWEERPADPEADPSKLPEFDKVGTTWLGIPRIAARTKYSLVFILAMAFSFMLLTGEPVASRGVDPTPVEMARGGDTLWIDGNRDGYGVMFKHELHARSPLISKTCTDCHHMNFPDDENTGCYRCHSDMYLPTDAFRHDWHASPQGADLACMDCHEADKSRSKETAKGCESCHHDLYPAGAKIIVDEYQAMPYTDAMHTMCVDCHREVAETRSDQDFYRCSKCHAEQRTLVDVETESRVEKLIGKGLIIPPAK